MTKCRLKPQWDITSEHLEQLKLKGTVLSVDKDMKQLELLYVIGKRINRHTTLENCLAVSLKAKHLYTIYKVVGKNAKQISAYIYLKTMAQNPHGNFIHTSSQLEIIQKPANRRIR